MRLVQVPNSPPVVIQNKLKARKTQCLRAFLFLPFSNSTIFSHCRGGKFGYPNFFQFWVPEFCRNARLARGSKNEHLA
jgi:hypothetical protein